jgi:hypothetical protein
MTQERKQTQPTEDWSQPPAEYFSDVFWTALSPWSAVVTFGLRMARPDEKDKPTIRIRMPLQQAKALAVILLRAVRKYETDAKVNIELPTELLKILGIPIEDWKQFTEQ